MSDAYMNTLREQSRLFERVFGSIVRPARRVVEQPAEAEQPDLIAEVEQCAAELEEAAKIIECGFPQAAQLFHLASRRAIASAAKARELGNAA